MTGCSFSVLPGWMPVLEAPLPFTECICFRMAIIYPCFALLDISSLTSSALHSEQQASAINIKMVQKRSCLISEDKAGW